MEREIHRLGEIREWPITLTFVSNRVGTARYFRYILYLLFKRYR